MKIKNAFGGAAVGLIAAMAFAGGAYAHHAAPTATVTTGDCGEVTITTAWSADEHHVGTAALVVLIDGEVTTAAIGESVTVGPFEADTTVQYRLWGGGERNYDDPPLADLEALLAYLDQGGDVLDSDAPGVAWHSLEVTGCPEPDPTTPPTTPTPATPPADNDDGDAAGTGGGDDDTLPVTGSTAMLLGGGAVLLLGLGTGVYLAARRRRVTFVA